MNNSKFLLKKGTQISGDVLYWMSREQRAEDNRSLFYAFEESILRKCSLRVVFAINTVNPDFGIYQLDFTLKGLKELSENLQNLNIHFDLLQGNLSEILAEFINSGNYCCIYTDFYPLKNKRREKKELSEKINAEIYEVDSHNIVPCRIASDKLEFSAYTIRNKINSKLNLYLEEYVQISRHPFNQNVNNIFPEIDFKQLNNQSVCNELFIPGEKAAKDVLNNFIKNRLNQYAEKRNIPELDFQSSLSPYLHFGQISAQRIALEIMKSDAEEEAKKVFLEELIIRRELSDNFCFYNSDYDNLEGFHIWAKQTLSEHLKDKREFNYSHQQFENAETHDIYWNAAQNEMLKTGKMHGYMRMYWAKKILEWTTSPMEAMETAIFLNDKYSLDGNDPNGYTGIAWSIGGIHDRAWGERPVFGKIRYMNAKGLERKSDIGKYVEKVNGIDTIQAKW